MGVTTETKQLSPLERLTIALYNQDNDVLLRESVAYVKSKVSAKYPQAYVKGALVDDDMSDAYEFHLMQKTREPVEIRSFFRNKLLRTEMQDVERSLATAWYFGDVNYLRVNVNDPDLYRACQEVTELTNGEICTQI